MSLGRIAAIVEGHGETEAVPVLVRRLAERAGYAGQVEVMQPVNRQPASKLLKRGELERNVELAFRKLGGSGGVFVLLDCDDRCAAREGPVLKRRIESVRAGMPVALVLACREYESWFLASASSLAGKRGFPEDLQPPDNPEVIRGCKEWLTHVLPGTRRYRETEDQPALTALFDLELAKARSDSFDKCCRELTSLIQKVVQPAQPLE